MNYDKDLTPLLPIKIVTLILFYGSLSFKIVTFICFYVLLSFLPSLILRYS